MINLSRWRLLWKKKDPDPCTDNVNDEKKKKNHLSSMQIPEERRCTGRESIPYDAKRITKSIESIS